MIMNDNGYLFITFLFPGYLFPHPHPQPLTSMAHELTLARRLGIPMEIHILSSTIMCAVEVKPVKVNKWNGQEVRVALDDLVSRVYIYICPIHTCILSNTIICCIVFCGGSTLSRDKDSSLSKAIFCPFTHHPWRCHWSIRSFHTLFSS